MRCCLIIAATSTCFAQLSTSVADSNSCDKIEAATRNFTTLIVEYHAQVEHPEWSSADLEAYERRLHRELDIAEITDPQRRNDVPNQAIVESLCRNYELRVRDTIDLTQRQVRRERFDLRDLDTIAAEYNLGHWHRMSINQSGVELLSGRTHVLLLEHADRLALLSDRCMDPLDVNMEQLGIGDVRTNPDLQQVQTRADGELVLTTLQNNKPVTERRFDDHGRLIRRTHFHADEPAHMIEHQDFREFDGVWLPTLTRITDNRSGRVETRRLQSVVVNAPINEPLFAIPPGYRVQDSRDPGRLNEVEVAGGLRETFAP